MLLALGHQIGMAVENSYLIQQTARRSEELHVLNEIGRALSSTLNKEDLLRKIWEELRRLFDVENFYIAEFDAENDEIVFELEMIGGERHAASGAARLEILLPNTLSAPASRYSFAIITLLKSARWASNPFVQRGCFCGVPLVAYDRVIGAMAVFSDHERTFDEGHLELMRVLASEASIAIENARLFQEERTKARHLTLLNTISENAIATLNPDEMLAKITGQLEEGLTYDHFGIGVLEYATREIVIQSEAGQRRGTLGMRIPLDSGLIGHVARNGHMAVFRAAVPADAALRPLLADSLAAIALPVFYGEQLHGILYIESSVAMDFSEEEILLLRTLADLIAGALHNSLSFQKAQEQAITDGLTGVKTHRFFMEALSAEWKRSTRAARAFALVLMDLDRFKFVNDFYGHLEGDLVSAARGTHSRNQLPPLRRGGALRRRRICNPHAGNYDGARAPAGHQAQRLGFFRSLIAREEYQRQLWHCLLSAARIFAAGTDSGRRRFHVPVQTSGRERGLHRRPLRSQ